MAEYRFGHIDNLLFLGGTPLLTRIFEKLQGWNAYLITAPRFLEEESHLPGVTFEEALKKFGVEYEVQDKLDVARLKSYVNPGTFGLSSAAPWILKQEVIDLFGGRLINAHGKRLPQNRGGGGFSWTILQGIRNGYAVYHFLNAGVDEGDLLHMREIRFPPGCETPQDFEDVHQVEMKDAFFEILDKVRKGEAFHPMGQNHHLSTYWPRLSTDHHGWLDWNWSLDEIQRFVNAFSDPHKGAATRVYGEEVRIKSVHRESNDGVFHPFQRGIIYRITDQNLYVAHPEGTLVIGRVFDGQGEAVALNQFTVGDRFFTPSEDLDRSFSVRATYGARGLTKNRISQL